MARIKKKGTSGNAKNYITRSQAVRKLQISLPDFRRLCIYKGVYPREPRSKKKASKSSTPSTTFYYAKDIQYLLHEPLLAKFREQKAFAKKISRALGRNEIGHASRLEKALGPRLQLDHIIKERYPTFVDALRDLDDALSMVFLFANLPSTESVPAKVIATCKRLTLEFEQFLIRTHTLRKSFLSIKGIYYQATIEGQDILWLVPYQFVQKMDGDIDFRIMASFVEFYTTLLGFVNFRLYTKIGLTYPPQYDTESEDRGAGLGAISLQTHSSPVETTLQDNTDPVLNRLAQSKADTIVMEEQTRENIEDKTQNTNFATTLDKFSPIDSTADALMQPSSTADSQVASQLFKDQTIFLSRETPRHSLELLLRAFGCNRIGWDSSICEGGAFCAESDGRITHQIVDRPVIGHINRPEDSGEAAQTDRRIPGRIYVQPQWVWDSINAGTLQRADLYGPGALLPPHLSPWIKPRKGEYDPTISLEEQETVLEKALADTSADEDADSESHERPSHSTTLTTVTPRPDVDLLGETMDVQLAESDASVDGSEELNEYSDDQWDGLSVADTSEHEDDDDITTSTLRQHQAELEAELRGEPTDTMPRVNETASRQHVKAAFNRAEKHAREDIERRKMMVSRRKRKMYEKMVYSNARKDEESERLRQKRRKLENEGKAKSTEDKNGVH